MELDLTYEQYKGLSTSQKLDILYCNQKRTLDFVTSIPRLKKMQRMQWLGLGALGSAFLWLFTEFWKFK
jgi:hypothetical protein